MALFSDFIELGGFSNFNAHVGWGDVCPSGGVISFPPPTVGVFVVAVIEVLIIV